ncbi:glycosyl hydrolase [Curtobacterium caseinilyticum]|uniref:glucan endo-1,3-beta-D-glucosidase n=1 Tax=Curtobacterium caseinilyticum TaxID=3055137 RepID=A0ABT7TSH9_9MICO|nr:glycosyl hydrolase [Curtobacterium caseinilyticum]MDM7892550.1 glycosyl hydrolase [Curtobacterium caseinilyticum]
MRDPLRAAGRPADRRRASRPLLLVPVLTVVALLATACSGPGGTVQPTPSASATDTAASVDVAAQTRAVTALGTVASSTGGTMRLATGLTPPTNRWFSGLVFGPAPQPVFPTPISWQVTGRGFAAGLPVVSATEKTIAGGAVQQVGFTLGATSTLVSAYDAVSVTVEHRAGSTVLGHSVIAEGSPLVTYTAARDGKLSATVPVVRTGDGTATMTGGGRTWQVVVRDGTIAASGVTLRRGGSVVLLPTPDGASSKQVAALVAAARPLTGATLARSASGGAQRTTLSYAFRGGAGVLVPQPGQGTSGLTCTGLRYATIQGSAPVCTGTALRFAVDTVTPSDRLDLSGLTSAQRSTLAAQVRKDAARVDASSYAADSYGGGKDLYRVASLYRLAVALRLDAQASALKTSIVAELDQWFDPAGCGGRTARCFAYDPTVKGLVGQQASFGSDEFNDHHFHYGYVLSAAAMVADGDASLVQRWRTVADLVASDIASPTATASFPALRVYDPYAQHSWASGYSPFADGNNQESSSEAVSAWNGVARWGAVSGSSSLRSVGTWLLSNEAASAQRDVLDPDLSAFPGFTHRVVSLTWGGKRDHATWFSAAAAAPAGIELIPMPAMAGAYVGAGGRKQVQRVLAEAVPNGRYDVQFGDYLLMYRALGGKADAATALRAAQQLPDAVIDSANTRSYLLAWIMTRA